jgi:hypothetical protein
MLLLLNSGCIGFGPHGGPAFGIPGVGPIWYPGMEDGRPKYTKADRELLHKVAGGNGRSMKTAVVLRDCVDDQDVTNVEHWYISAFGLEDSRATQVSEGRTYHAITYVNRVSGKSETLTFDATHAIKVK